MQHVMNLQVLKLHRQYIALLKLCINFPLKANVYGKNSKVSKNFMLHDRSRTST